MDNYLLKDTPYGDVMVISTSEADGRAYLDMLIVNNQITDHSELTDDELARTGCPGTSHLITKEGGVKKLVRLRM